MAGPFAAATAVEVGEVTDAEARSVLTKLELTYCRSRQRPEQHLAGRIAAKRAVMRLLDRAGYGQVDVQALELAPVTPPFAAALAWAPARRAECRAVADGDPELAQILAEVRVSISHHGTLAVAAAITVGPDGEQQERARDGSRGLAASTRTRSTP